MYRGSSKAKTDGSQAHFVLATWWFVHPHVAPRFAEFVRDSLHHAGGLQEFMPKPEHWELMFAFGSQHAIDGRDVVVVLNQGPDIALVPPAWPHAVSNVMPCGKLAWDHYDPGHLATYAAVHRDVASPLFRGDSMAKNVSLLPLHTVQGGTSLLIAVSEMLEFIMVQYRNLQQVDVQCLHYSCQLAHTQIT